MRCTHCGRRGTGRPPPHTHTQHRREAHLVHAHEVAWPQRVGVHEADNGQEDGLARGRLEHDALALPLRVEVCGRAVLLLLLLGLDVQHLHDVADEVRQLVVQLDLLLVLLDFFAHAVLVQRQPRGLVLEHADLVLQQPRALADRVRRHVLKLLGQRIVGVLKHLLLYVHAAAVVLRPRRLLRADAPRAVLWGVPQVLLLWLVT
jgi:hypothetical protein